MFCLTFWVHIKRR